jgi:PAS domain S-box-containing protein
MQGENDLESTRGEAQARLAAIVESSDDAIVSKTLQGIIKTWNKGAERIFGWTADEVIGKPITIIIPPDRLQEEPVILSRIQAGERVDHFQTIRVTKDGRKINISVTISPVRDETGRIIGASKIARDITEQKRLQRELEEAKESAEAANRAKDHFLSVLSHELRTPLTPVLAAVSLIEQDPAVPREFAEQLRMIRRNVETEARLVDDLLDLTRIARGKVQLHPEVLDAHAIIRHVIGMFDAEAEAKGLTVALALRARQSQVWADPGRFQQVLLNLVSNAVKFTPAGGRVTLSLRRAWQSADGGTYSEPRPGAVPVAQLSVRDTGIGIPTGEQGKMFTRFFRASTAQKNAVPGVGLGLAITKAITTAHGGTLDLQSAEGAGTTFTLTLPRA